MVEYSQQKHRLVKSLIQVEITADNKDQTFITELTRLHDKSGLTLTKKYQHFVDMRSELETNGYIDLPQLPE